MTRRTGSASFVVVAVGCLATLLPAHVAAQRAPRPLAQPPAAGAFVAGSSPTADAGPADGAPSAGAGSDVVAGAFDPRLLHYGSGAPVGSPGLADTVVPGAMPPRLQEPEYQPPGKYVIGGLAIGAFAGGLVGLSNCTGDDADCSVLWSLVAGTGIGGALGAVFWLASVPQD